MYFRGEDAVMRQTANCYKTELLLPNSKLGLCSYVHDICFSQVCHFRLMTQPNSLKTKIFDPLPTHSSTTQSR